MKNINLFIIVITALFLITLPGVLAWSDDSSPTQNVDGCGDMTTDGAVYTLTANIISNSTCFNITENNIYLDMAGFNITADVPDSGSSGIIIDSKNNITIEGNNGIISGWDSDGLYMINTSESTIQNLTTSNNSVGLDLVSSEANVFYDVTSNGNAVGGLLMVGSENNGFINLVANNNTMSGVILQGLSNGNLFVNVTTAYNNLGIVLSNSTGNYIYNLQSYDNVAEEVSSTAWINATTNVLIYTDTGTINDVFGQIIFSPLNADIEGDLRYGTGKTIEITTNNASFHSSEAPGLNISATVYLNGLVTNMYQPQIYKDEAVCTDCVAITSLNAGDVEFTVTSWSDYSVRGGTAPSCSDFTRGMTYLIPGFMALAVLIAGGVVFAIGFQKNNIKTLMASFIIIILGLVFVQIISGIVITAC
jgi:hypothetical protein